MHEFGVTNKQELVALVSPLAVSQCVVAARLKCCLCLGAEITFHPAQQLLPQRLPSCTAKTTPAPPKIYNGQNTNIFPSLIAGQTSLNMLDLVFALQQMGSDKRSHGGCRNVT